MDLYELPEEDALQEGACFGQSFYLARASQVTGMGVLDVASTLAGHSNISDERRGEVLLLQEEFNELRTHSYNTIEERNSAIAELLSRNLLESDIITVFSSGIPNSDAQALTHSYTGNLNHDPSYLHGFNNGLERVLNEIGRRISRNKKTSVVVSSLLFRESQGHFTHSTYHAFSIDIGRDGTVFFSDPSVGQGVFRDFRTFSRFFRDYISIPYGRDTLSPMYHILGDIIFVRSDIESSRSSCGSISSCACVSSPPDRRAEKKKKSELNDNLKLKSHEIQSSTFLNNDFFCEDKLILKNLNYEDLTISIYSYFFLGYYYKVGKNIKLNSGASIELKKKDGKYYYKNMEISFIDLDNGAKGAPNTDFVDNIIFRESVTYKPAVLWDETDLIRKKSTSKYFETMDLDGIGGKSNQANITSYAIHAVEYIEISKWGTKKIDMSKLEKLTLKNVSYDNIILKVRLRVEGWDTWITLHRDTPTLELDYSGNGEVRYKGNLLQQIDMYNTYDLSYASGDEFDFKWYNPTQINYRPYYIGGGRIPVLALVDFKTGNYANFVDPDGVNGSDPQMQIKIEVEDNGKTLSIEFHGDHQENRQKEVTRSTKTKNKIPPEVLIYPNPTSDYIRLQSTYELANQKITAVDVSGRIYNLWVEADNRVDVSNLANGMYLLKTSINDKVFKFYKI